MATIEQANAINNHVQWLSTSTPIERAREVLGWCQQEGIYTDLTAKSLAAGMGHYPYWHQGPTDYLDLVLAAQEMCPERHVECPNCHERFQVKQDRSIDAVIGA